MKTKFECLNNNYKVMQLLNDEIKTTIEVKGAITLEDLENDILSCLDIYFQEDLNIEVDGVKFEGMTYNGTDPIDMIDGFYCISDVMRDVIAFDNSGHILINGEIIRKCDENGEFDENEDVGKCLVKEVYLEYIEPDFYDFLYEYGYNDENGLHVDELNEIEGCQLVECDRKTIKKLSENADIKKVCGDEYVYYYNGQCVDEKFYIDGFTYDDLKYIINDNNLIKEKIENDRYFIINNELADWLEINTSYPVYTFEGLNLYFINGSDDQLIKPFEEIKCDYLIQGGYSFK